jgi:N-acetylglucosamine kinase-like BadF-type ATPase
MAILVFGADGGGTKTEGVLATPEGEVLARCHAGASNPNVVGVDESASCVWGLIRECCQSADRMPSEIGAAVLGLAGAGTPAIRDRLLSALRARLNEHQLVLSHLVLEHDARIALEGAFSGRPGVIVIAGTGSVVLAKTPMGEIIRIGGWGRVLGDEGSGYWIGREAVRSLARQFDGREPDGVLRRSIAERFGWRAREAVIVAVYQEEFPLASVAPLVLDACEAGDGSARFILERAADLLIEQLSAAASHVETEAEIGVVFLGGLIDHDTVYGRILAERLRAAVPRAKVHQPERSPSEGAVLMARALVGPGTGSPDSR